MDYHQAFFLALLQGVTEFLPISSSAHLILVPFVNGWADQGLAFDVAVHVGTLLAVIAYYRRDVYVMIAAWLRSIGGGQASEESRMAWYVILGTVPVGAVGVSMAERVEIVLRSPVVIAIATIVFALVLWWAEKRARENRPLVNWKDALVVGLFQAIALIPGTSRSGITMTAGLLLGFPRELAARFSFLLSMPVIALAGLVKTYDLIETQDAVQWNMIGVGVAVSAVIAYLTIGWFLRLLQRVGMFPFVVYRLLLGAVLLFLFLP